MGVALSGDPPAAKLNGVVHRVPAEAIKEAWNEICGSIGLPLVKVLSEKRKQGLRMRCAQLAKHFGSDVYTVDWWRNVFQRVADSPFCRGEGGRGWVATFDWLVTRPEAIIRLLEGQYDRVRKRNTDFEREREMRHGVSDWSGEKSGVVDVRAILRQRERG